MSIQQLVQFGCLCRALHFLDKSEDYGTKLLVCSMTLLSFFLLLAVRWIRLDSKFLIPSWHIALQSFRSKATCSKVRYGMLTAARLLLNLSLYQSHGLPTFQCPLSSWLYIRTLGILSSLILMTWPAQRSWDCMRKVSMPPILHLVNRSALEILSSRV